ncbi:hypothetical protein A5740_03055 [Mycobacterium sp. GA-1841]|uniref:hypothetical protein n=1 Tax=Mycobacterium sp. GA-1841 TaxID=1834154 RepID=UPI00096F3349|nr:hypothetical protein [Mycobacterium sp. GA-1841]OMC39032.1 hypothetical protein A5740_03055 [Mycobacterium sp. GA-1841]
MAADDRIGDPDDGKLNPYSHIDLLPDLHRTSNPWTQILRDLSAPAPMSHWAAEVTLERIGKYDRIRPFVTRGALLVIVVLMLSLAPATNWLSWLLLMPAGIQVALEIALDFELGESGAQRVAILAPLTAVAESAQNRTLINVTGLIGFVAVPCAIVAVAYGSGPEQPGWPKVVALAVAAAYGVSAMMSLLIDATHYSPHQRPTKPYRIFRVVRPHVWLVIMVLMTAIVAGSIAAKRWAPEMVPLAWALCAIPILIGTKQREYERFLRASSERLAKVQDDAKRELTKDFHNTNTDIRTFNRQLATDTSVPPHIRVRAAALAPLISLMSEAIDHDRWVRQQQRPSLSGIAKKYQSDAGLIMKIDLQLDDLQPRNYELARALLASLLVNVGQAMARHPPQNGDYHDASRPVTVSGEVRGGQVRIVVGDPLPLITDWLCDGSTTQWLHQDLIAHGSAEGLTQHLVDPDNPMGGKEIRAIWPVQKPALNLRDIRR